MEHVIVNYPENREVLVDGVENGQTNTVILVDEGTHIFSLGEPDDYEPESVEIVVENTSVLDPMEINFNQKG